MRFKNLSFFLLLLLVISLAAGCKKTPADSPETSAEAETTEPETTEPETTEPETTEPETTEPETTEPPETTPPVTTPPETTAPPTTAAPVLTVNDLAFIGDSRTLTMATGGRLAFELLPNSSVFATWGGQLTEESARANAAAAAASDPKIAIFWYGINDVQIGSNRDDAAGFRAKYEPILDLYQAGNPDGRIVILSILTTSVNEKDYYEGQNANIAAYNAQLQTLCAERGYTYLDITGLFTGDECFAEGDNIHFSKEWYQTRFLPHVLGSLGV